MTNPTPRSPMALVVGCDARARELHADASLTFRTIASVLTREFRLTPALTAAAMSGFYWRAGLKRGKTGRTSLGPQVRVVKMKRDIARANKIVKGIVKGRRRTKQSKQRGNLTSPEPMKVEAEGLLPTAFVVGEIDSTNFLAANWKKPTVTLRNLKDGMCKWPIECEDLTTEFCGARVVALNYCCDHAVGAYRLMPTEKRNASANKKQDTDRSETDDGPSFSETGDDAMLGQVAAVHDTGPDQP